MSEWVTYVLLLYCCCVYCSTWWEGWWVSGLVGAHILLEHMVRGWAMGVDGC